MLLDHVFMTAISFLFSISWVIRLINEMQAISNADTPRELVFPTFGNSIYMLMIGMALYICKDNIGGRSIAKRILKHQVINKNTGAPASPIRCTVRNLFIILWPLEVLAVLVNPERRIGDHVAGTMVVPYDPNTVKPKINFKQALLSFSIAYIAILGITLPVQKLTQGISFSPKYVPSSYNEQASNRWTAKMTNEFGKQNIDVGVRIYDKIKDSDKKYISIVLRAKGYTLNYSAYAFAKSNLGKELLQEYPKNSTKIKLTVISINGNSINEVSSYF